LKIEGIGARSLNTTAYGYSDPVKYAANPSAVVATPAGYVALGAGIYALSTYSGADPYSLGQYATALFPNAVTNFCFKQVCESPYNVTTWTATSKDHMISRPGWV